MSPHRVAGSLTSRHRSRRVKSVSALTLAMGCISLLRLDGLSFGVGYALLFAGPFYTIHRTLPGLGAVRVASKVMVTEREVFASKQVLPLGAGRPVSTGPGERLEFHVGVAQG